MRHRIAVAGLCATLLFLSCQQKNEHFGPQPIVADAHSAIVILPDLPLWTVTQETLGPTAVTIPLGEKLAIIGPPQKTTQDGKDREYQHVRRESGQEGWVRSDYAICRAILAVVTTDDAVIYSAEANSAATTATIPRMTVMAIHSESGGMPFIRVSCYDPSSKTMLRHVALRNEGVSSNPSDVQAAILLQLAASSKSQKQQKAFLTSAIKDYPDSLFMTDLQGALTALTAPRAAPAQTPSSPDSPGTPLATTNSFAAPAATPAPSSGQ